MADTDPDGSGPALSTAPLRWATLGTGAIAAQLAKALSASSTGELVAIGSRAPATAAAFAHQHAPRARPHGSYEALLADPDVDVVYVATPHPQHHEWAMRAADAGKHLLVEKPLTLNAHQTQEVIDAARRNDVFLMEAFMWRCHPQADELGRLLGEGVIGEVRVVEASFGFKAGFDPSSRLFDLALGGGAIMDVGCYTASMAVFVARLTGVDLDDPIQVTGFGRVGSSGVDESAAATVSFAFTDLVAELETAIRAQLHNTVRILGTDGSITLPTPWLPEPAAKLLLARHGHEVEEVRSPSTSGVFTLEVDEVAAHVAARQAPAMPWRDTLAVARITDAWRAAVGVRYPGEGETN